MEVWKSTVVSRMLLRTHGCSLAHSEKIFFLVCPINQLGTTLYWKPVHLTRYMYVVYRA